MAETFDVMMYKDAACEKALKLNSQDLNLDFSLSHSIFNGRTKGGAIGPRGRFIVWAKAINPVARVYCAVIGGRDYSTLLNFDEDAFQGRINILEGGRIGEKDITMLLGLVKYSSSPDAQNPSITLYSFKTPLFFVNNRGSEAYRLEAVDSAGNLTFSGEKPSEKEEIFWLKDIGDCNSPTPISVELTDSRGDIYKGMSILLMWG